MIKIRGFIKYHSCVIFPLITFVFCYLININSCFFDISDNKAASLSSIASSFIGVLITILTIYLAVPKTEFIKKRLKDSKHEHIYIFNILVGIIVLFASAMSWIFFENSTILSLLFISGISNIAIAIYYTFSLINLI